MKKRIQYAAIQVMNSLYPVVKTGSFSYNTGMENIEIIHKYNLPLSVKVKIQKTEQGYFAEFVDYPGLFTEASDWPELIYMITDALLTYFEVPQIEANEFAVYYVPYMQPTKNKPKEHVTRAIQFHALTSINPYEHTGIRS